MSKLTYALLLTGTLAGASFFIAPQTASADDYWNGYWTWYDNDYRPYQHRYYNRSYRNRYYDNDDYYRDYRYRGRYGNRYDRGYYNRGYYNRGYGRGWDDDGGYIQVGPLGIGWD